MIQLEPIILVISLAYEQACFGFQYTVRMTWMGKATGKLSSKWVPKIGHDVSHQRYIANAFGDDHRSPFSGDVTHDCKSLLTALHMETAALLFRDWELNKRRHAFWVCSSEGH